VWKDPAVDAMRARAAAWSEVSGGGISVAGSSGHLELNVFKPVMIHGLLQSIRHLLEQTISGGMPSSVVQRLEVVEVHECHRHGEMATFGAGQSQLGADWPRLSAVQLSRSAGQAGDPGPCVHLVPERIGVRQQREGNPRPGPGPAGPVEEPGLQLRGADVDGEDHQAASCRRSTR